MDELEGKKFLDLFPDLKRSGVMNQFLTAVRAVHAVDEILASVATNARKRISDPFLDADAKAVQRTLADNLHTKDAQNLAAYAKYWEALPATEKKRIKIERGKEFREEKMAEIPPTQKQLDYLQMLNCAVKPTTMAEASKLIEQHKARMI